jgi:hypothetical protein
VKTLMDLVKAWFLATAAFIIFVVVLTKLLPARYSSGGEFSGGFQLILGMAFWCVIFAWAYSHFKKLTPKTKN